MLSENEKVDSNQDDGVTIEAYVKQDEKSDFKDKPTNQQYYAMTENDKPLIIGKKKNEADFIIENKSAVSPKHLQIVFIKKENLPGMQNIVFIEPDQSSPCLYIVVSNLGMNSTSYRIEAQENKSELKKMKSNEAKIFRISQANGVFFQLGSKKTVKVHIRKANKQNVIIHSQGEDTSTYFQEYVCNCGINFKTVKCLQCNLPFMCQPCFIFQRKKVLIKNQIQKGENYDIKCERACTPLKADKLLQNYIITEEGRVLIKNEEQLI